ncbi:MAG: hypothetical protein IPK02_11820 [Candidatus Accumulibacter sp.]|uniref:Phage tail protein n=1 Tax=Candidatus Accumulibacter affinis TaxID=2954384 RepID=A0A935T7T2_9PROT|nr:hypothetical protein [Candidatus Accumulibacter affinis]
MSITKTTGLVLAAVSTCATAVNMTAITNASEAVATLQAGHGVLVGDLLEMTSGWGRLNGRLVRAKTVATNDVTLEGVNTTSTVNYPAGAGTGAGTGTVRRANASTGLINMSQIKLISTSGGELAFEDVTAVDDVVARQITTIRSPVQLQITIFDDPTLAWYATLLAADEAGTPLGFRMGFPNGSKLLFNAYVCVARVPTIEANMSLKTNISLAFSADPIRYPT